MRRFWPSFILLVAGLVPNVGHAQAYRETPPPRVTAAASDWQINGEPVLFQGDLYYPTAARVFFDGTVMMPIGAYEGVPIYADATLEPFTVVFVPVAGNMMRRYERRHAGELTGREGSGVLPPEVEARQVGTGGRAARSASPVAAPPAPERSTPTSLQSVPGPQSNDGIWVFYDGSRWYSAGPAVKYSSDRFTPVGVYHEFPVYRDQDGDPDEIFVVAVTGGPLTPYRRNK